MQQQQQEPPPPTIAPRGPSPPAPDHDEEAAAVLSVVAGLLDAVPSKDAGKMLAYCHPGCGAVRMRGADLVVESLETVCAAIAGLPGQLWEGFVGPDVKIYHDLAMVWSKNEVKVDGELVAVGCNAITLHKVAGEWKITSIADTAHPPPPPLAE